MLSFKKYIGTREFYRRVIALALPILAQNAITNFTSLLDNVMIGRLGTEQMSGVSIVNQLFFVFNLALFGLVSGTGLFGSQSYGKGDHKGVTYTFRFGLYAVIPLLTLAFALFLGAGDKLISLYLHEGSATGNLELTLMYAKQYLSIALFGLIPFTVSQVYSGSLRATGRTVVPMLSGIVGFVFNLTLNYILIFGAFGFPTLGVRGAAIATVIARVVECLFLVVYTHSHSREIHFIRGAFRSFYIPRALVSQIIIKGMPLLVNEALFALGQSMLIQSYSLRGLATVSGLNICATLYDSFNVLIISSGVAISIVLGHILGSNDTERAKDESYKLCAFNAFAGIMCGAFLAVLAPLFPLIYNTTDEVRSLATSFLLVRACAAPLYGWLHGCYFTVRSGGKTISTFFFDSGFVFLVKVPLSYLLVLCTSMPIILVFIAVHASLIIKCVIGYIMVKRGNWAVSLINEKSSLKGQE